ncbi:16273_t:CDS:2, partial [Racocetra persica]
PSFLIQKLAVWLKDQPPPPFFDLSVNEILYYFNGSWKCHLYYDDFGTFRTVYHSLDLYLLEGISETLSNRFLKKLRNLKKGLGVFTSDLSQRNDITGILHHNWSISSSYGSRVPAYKSTNFKNCKIETLLSIRITDFTGPLDPILHDRHLHIPQDAYHAIAGKVARLLDCTCLILISYGANNLINYWKHFEVPSQWSRLPNPITHRHLFMMSDNLRILMIFPFILKRCLTVKSIKNDFLISMQERLHFSHRSDVCDCIIHTWVLSAKTAKE